MKRLEMRPIIDPLTVGRLQDQVTALKADSVQAAGTIRTLRAQLGHLIEDPDGFVNGTRELEPVPETEVERTAEEVARDILDSGGTTKQAAAEAGVDARTVRRWRQQGKLEGDKPKPQPEAPPQRYRSATSMKEVLS